MWIYFMSFASVYLISEARDYFQKAVSYVGTDPKSNKLWDNYVMFESSCVGVPLVLEWHVEYSWDCGSSLQPDPFHSI